MTHAFNIQMCNITFISPLRVLCNVRGNEKKNSAAYNFDSSVKVNATVT